MNNADEAAFDAQRGMLFSNIARTLGGEKGVLSDQDIKRIEKTIPSLGDSPEQRTAKIQIIKDIIDDRLVSKGFEPYFSKAQQGEKKIGKFTARVID